MSEETNKMPTKAEPSVMKQDAPFMITDDLRHLLSLYPNEFGVANGVGAQLPADHYWIAVDNDAPVGYAWTAIKNNGVAGTHVNLIVSPASQGRGVGGRLLSAVELFMAAAGVSTMHAQVNSNQPQSGLRMRRLLLKQGYIVVRDVLGQDYGKQTDEQIIANEPSPVFFTKRLVLTNHSA